MSRLECLVFFEEKQVNGEGKSVAFVAIRSLLRKQGVS